MADSALQLSEIADIFWECTVRNLGLDPNSKTSQKRIRKGYPAEGAPAWKRTENVGFILVSFENDPYAQPVEISYNRDNETAADQIASYTRVIQVSWTFYGPSSYDDADKVRTGLFLNPLLFAPMHLITDAPTPYRLPELFEGQWWERSTLVARFNEKVTRSTKVNYIESADIRVIPNR